MPQEKRRPRIREARIIPGILSTGPLNMITDVDGVTVGQVTLIEGQDVRTGATAILPHSGNLYQDKVPAGFVAGNGFGKFVGATQIWELGEIETPILLTNTLSVARAAEAILDWTLAQPGNENVFSVNPVVGETNDGYLNDIRSRSMTVEHYFQAIQNARGGAVEEGTVGAGTGTAAFGWKGGIGTSSRQLPEHLDGYTVGALVQTNFGGILQVVGAPIGLELGQFYLKNELEQELPGESIMIVLATDAPLSDRNLNRLARRAMAGLARTGAAFNNGSGDYCLSFSTSESVRRTPRRREQTCCQEELPNDLISPLFLAAIEATEEAIYNSLFRATSISGHQGHRLEALPIDQCLDILQKYEQQTG